MHKVRSEMVLVTLQVRREFLEPLGFKVESWA